MSIVPKFDALSGSNNPTAIFGEPLGASQTLLAIQALSSVAQEARSRVEQSFEQVIEPASSGVAKLDRIIQGMWESEWSPQSPSFNLFCTDFGALYAEAFLSVGSLSPVFRSSSVLDQMSLWQAASRQEFFPFHKVAKALSSSRGESLMQMFDAAQQCVQAATCETHAP